MTAKTGSFQNDVSNCLCTGIPFVEDLPLTSKVQFCSSCRFGAGPGVLVTNRSSRLGKVGMYVHCPLSTSTSIPIHEKYHKSSFFLLIYASTASIILIFLGLPPSALLSNLAEASMADMQSPQHPMEVLPAMLNLVVSQLSSHNSLFYPLLTLYSFCKQARSCVNRNATTRNMLGFQGGISLILSLLPIKGSMMLLMRWKSKL